MCWLSYENFSKELVSWKFIPGEISSQKPNTPFVRYLSFPIEDILELKFVSKDYPGQYIIHTFSVLNFVWRGSAKRFKIEKFMRAYHKKWNKDGGRLDIRYNKHQFTLVQIQVANDYFGP